jgi:dipeptidyl aminopeptidase/acylaminoacyl peptidase
MNNVVNFCIFFLFAVPVSPAFSQTNRTFSDYNHPLLKRDRWNVDKYVWSNAKNKIGKNGKRAIDFDAIDNWKNMGEYLSVSNNGKYFAYTIESVCGPWSSQKKVDSLVVQSTNGSSRWGLVESDPGFFTQDSKLYIFRKGTSLRFLHLNGTKTEFVNDILSYKVSDHDKTEWLAYNTKGREAEIVLRNLVSGKERRFSGLSDYKFDNTGEWLICESNSDMNNRSKELLWYHLTTGSERQFSSVVDYLLAGNGKSLLLKTIKNEVGKTITSLEYVILSDGRQKNVWSASEKHFGLNNYSIDKLGGQVVFTVSDSSGYAASGLPDNSIWYYKVGMNNAILKVSNQTAGINERLAVQGSASFTDNGRYIKFLLLHKPLVIKDNASAVGVDVWNYKDSLMQYRQNYLLKNPSQTIQAVINVDNERPTLLEGNGKSLYALRSNFAVCKKELSGDRFWEKNYVNEDSAWLFDLNTGNWKAFEARFGVGERFWFSSSGNYLVYYNSKNGHYNSYDSRTGEITDITNDDNDRQLGLIETLMITDKRPERPNGLAAWLEDDAGILVYDNNDIWQFDLQGKKQAINLTNGIGRSNDIVFSLFNSFRSAVSDEIPVVTNNESLLLRAFNTKNKYSGFYRKIVGVNGDPQLLSMDKYLTHVIPGCQDPWLLSNPGIKPLKAVNANLWIVQRQSETEAPNYYKTADFKTFKQLSNFHPENGYSWLSEELHSFSHLDGKLGQGILYKPENFDPNKKYPVLIIFYGKYSNSLNQFPVPEYISDAVTPGRSPNWFLSNGYLVFTPDIYLAPLKYGPAAFNVIEGAARYLKQLPYVDGNKLGCGSHSFSAKLGAYLFTHSNSFAAMTISEGYLYANMINVAFSMYENDGTSHLESVEEDFEFGSLWKNRGSWLDQTTVLNVDNAISPLLLFCNKGSSSDYQDQTLQLFTASRRLDKKVWWLKYDKGAHNLYDLDEQKDYTIRYTQYFDHYLKDAPAPHWMTRGVPAAMKGINMAYELDPSGTCALDSKKDCEICKKWNEQYRRTPEMFTKPIAEWQLDADLATELKTKNQNQESTTHREK